MPTRMKKKPVAPVAPAPPPEAAPAPEPVPVAVPANPLPVIYDKTSIEIEEYSTTSPKGPLTVADLKDILGWETEKEYQKRKVDEELAKGNAGAKPEHFLFGDFIKDEHGRNHPVHCRNLAGEKVVCWYNTNNRPFDEGWCQKLVHSHMHGKWAGPHTLPGETVNGETLRISRRGEVLSAQHSVTSAILANEFLQRDREKLGAEDTDAKYPAWKGHPEVFLETIVVRGVSDDPRVIMTVDYVKPRTAADVFYTSDVFKSAAPAERKELCDLLAVGTDFLWTRTATRGYRTHPEVVGFLERHKKLMELAVHIYTENGSGGRHSGGKLERKISKLRLSPGKSAAMCYLMAASGTTEEDSDVYRNMEPPSEKGIDFTFMDKAQDFWVELAGGPGFLPVRMALDQLVDSTPDSEVNQGLGGRELEKLAIIANAWEVYRDHPGPDAGPTFSKDDLAPGECLCLDYSDLDDKGNKLPNGRVKLVNVPDFLGIDCPETTLKTSGRTRTEPPDGPAPTGEEYERLKEEARARQEAARARQVGGK